MRSNPLAATILAILFAMAGPFPIIAAEPPRVSVRELVRISSHGLKNSDGKPASPLPSVRTLALRPDGRMLALSGEPEDPSQPREIHLIALPGGEVTRVLRAEADPLSSIEFSLDGRSLLSVSPRPRGLIVWDVVTGRDQLRMDGGRAKIRVLAETGQVAIADSFGRTDIVRRHDLRTGAEVGRDLVPVSYRLEFSTDGEKLLAMRRYGDASLALLSRGRERETALTGLETMPREFRLARGGRTAVATTADGQLVAWEILTGTLATRLSQHGEQVPGAKPSPLTSLALHPTGRWACGGSADGKLHVWDLYSGELQAQWAGHRLPVSALVFSSDGRRLASGSFDRTAALWDLEPLARGDERLPAPGEALLNSIWEDLASPDPGKAYRGMGRGAAARQVTLQFLERQVSAALSPTPDATAARLLRELDDPDSLVRSRATEQLRKLREPLRPLLLRTLRETTSAEVRQRLRRILRPLADSPRFTKGDLLRFRRVIHFCEESGGNNARKTLDQIARLVPDAATSSDARSVLSRLPQK